MTLMLPGCGLKTSVPYAASPKAEQQIIGRNRFRWPDGKLGAVTLSYDDAIPSHCHSVAPELDKAGLRATFYIQVDYDGFTQNLDVWRKVAQAGHELGNHSLFHPCRVDRPGQHTWLSPDYNLSNYTPNRWLREMRTANLVLHLLDGKTERTFGNTCCDNYLSSGSDKRCLEEFIPELFVAGRGEFVSKPVDIKNINYANLGHFGGDGKTFEQLRDEIESAVRQGKWIFYMIHGIGKGTHSLYIEADEHAKLIEYLSANRDRIWTAPAVDVAKYIKQFETGK